MEKADWRITNQKNYLNHVKLNKKKYHLEIHNHCEFCWYEFMIDDIGYTTDDAYHWICHQCFEDFISDFDWLVNIGE